MFLNLTVLSGRVAAPPELRTFTNGATYLRLLVTVKQDEPKRRVDVIPVTVWDPDPELADAKPGQYVWVAASIQRRFLADIDGRRSRLEVVANAVEIRDEADQPV